MGRSVIVAYAPKPGKERELLAAVRTHLTVLRGEGLVTDRAPYVLQAANGTIVEVFEWRSAQAIEQAHKNPAVLALWSEFDSACKYTPLAKLPEGANMFAEFETITFE